MDFQFSDLPTLFNFVFTFESNFILVCFLLNLYFITILPISISYIHLFLNYRNLFSKTLTTITEAYDNSSHLSLWIMDRQEWTFRKHSDLDNILKEMPSLHQETVSDDLQSRGLSVAQIYNFVWQTKNIFYSGKECPWRLVKASKSALICYSCTLSIAFL